MTLPKCPDDLASRADALWSNALGFQGPGASGDYFVIARLNGKSNVLERVKQSTGANTLCEVDFLGGTFLKIHWTEYPLIDKVLTTLLEEGVGFCTFTKTAKTSFDPSEGDRVYSREIFEKKIIKDFNYNVEFVEHSRLAQDAENKYRYVYNGYQYNNTSIAHEWCWQTEEGKKFCRDLRKKLGKNEFCTNSKYDFTKWPRFQNYDPVTLMTALPTLTSDDSENDSDDECMICLTNKANTMVAPPHTT